MEKYATRRRVSKSHLSEEVIVDLEAMVGEGLCEVVGGADEEVVAHDIPDHLLVEVAVVSMLPVCVLQHKC